ncbi:MAG: type IV pilus modification protein PilV [Saccharospirillum sp.]|uniref:type IV pilus modification protein PilV n=1 Tax=Saccharospirillum sp. TaxID=2033801 RepID=UPI003297F6B0
MSVNNQPVAGSNQGGFSLIEVLVTVVILAVGLLGVAGVQALGLRTANVALEHSLVTTLATDIAERIRANPIAFQADQYVIDVDVDNPPGGNECSQACSTQDRAESDILGWYNRLLILDQVSAEITRNGTVAEISISWVEPGIGFGGDDAEQAQNFVYQTRLN